MTLADLPNLDARSVDMPTQEKLLPMAHSSHKPRILLLYGSLRERSYSRLLTAGGGAAPPTLRRRDAHLRSARPAAAGQRPRRPPQGAGAARARRYWSEGQVWCSPERHGTITGVMKTQIDWIPLAIGAVRPTQGRTLAVMQVSGGSQSFNAVNAAARARPLDAHGHHPEPVVGRQGLSGVRRGRPDEAVVLLRPRRRRDGGAGASSRCSRASASDYLTDRYSERKEVAEREALRLSKEAMSQEVQAAE